MFISYVVMRYCVLSFTYMKYHEAVNILHINIKKINCSGFIVYGHILIKFGEFIYLMLNLKLLIFR